jgi:hypothetical protein
VCGLHYSHFASFSLRTKALAIFIGYTKNSVLLIFKLCFYVIIFQHETMDKVPKVDASKTPKPVLHPVQLRTLGNTQAHSSHKPAFSTEVNEPE